MAVDIEISGTIGGGEPQLNKPDTQSKGGRIRQWWMKSLLRDVLDSAAFWKPMEGPLPAQHTPRTPIFGLGSDIGADIANSKIDAERRRIERK